MEQPEDHADGGTGDAAASGPGRGCDDAGAPTFIDGCTCLARFGIGGEYGITSEEQPICPIHEPGQSENWAAYLRGLGGLGGL